MKVVIKGERRERRVADGTRRQSEIRKGSKRSWLKGAGALEEIAIARDGCAGSAG